MHRISIMIVFSVTLLAFTGWKQLERNRVHAQNEADSASRIYAAYAANYSATVMRDMLQGNLKKCQAQAIPAGIYVMDGDCHIYPVLGRDLAPALQQCIAGLPKVGGVCCAPAGEFTMSAPIDQGGRRFTSIIGNDQGMTIFFDK